MNTASRWKLGLCLAGLFVAGAVTGSLVTLKVVKTAVLQRTNPDNWESMIMGRLEKRLKLTPAQEEKIKPAVGRLIAEIRKAGTDTRGQALQALAEAKVEIEPVLTPEQKAELSKMGGERNERIRRFFRERNDAKN